MHFVLELNQQLRGVIKNERTDRKGGGYVHCMAPSGRPPSDATRHMCSKSASVRT